MGAEESKPKRDMSGLSFIVSCEEGRYKLVYNKFDVSL